MADPTPSEVDKINNILNRNKKKNFVKRIASPGVYPNIDMGRDEQGRRMIGTHFMMSGEADNKHYVYPSIIQDEAGKLQKLEPNDAFDYAMQSGEHIEFDSPEEADWFAKNYKKVWGQ